MRLSMNSQQEPDRFASSKNAQFGSTNKSNIQVTNGSEAAIHAMHQVFNEEGADGVLLIDATNTFNQMNRTVAMHNIRITCKEIALYIINTYRSPSRLFISGGGEISSQEGTTQGDPLAMPWYAINTNLMIRSLRASIPQVKQVWLADDSAGGGSIESLYQWYKTLSEEGKKFGYIVNGAKSCLSSRTVNWQRVQRRCSTMK